MTTSALVRDITIHCRNVSGEWVGSFLHCYDQAQVFSPYITSSLAEKALDAECPNIIEIYTRFEIEAFAAGASSLATLKRLLERGHPLFHVPRLHAKIFFHPRKFVTIGSQNLTQRGMSNREATVVVRDAKLMLKLRSQLERWTQDRRTITADMIEAAEAVLLPLRRDYRKLVRQCRAFEQKVFDAEDGRQREREEAVQRTQAELRTYQEHLQAKLASMGDGKSVPFEFCRSVGWNATDWLIQRRIVRSRRDADRLRRPTSFGWEIPLGENRFGIELAIRWCREEIEKMFPRDQPRSFALTPQEISRLRVFVQAAVIGHKDRLYGTRYPVKSDGRMWFGNHAVNPANTVSAILHFAGFETAT